MTFPTSRQVDSAERVVETIDSTLSNMLDQLQAWRERIDASSNTDSGDAQARYQEIVAVKVFVDGKKNTPGLAEAYERRFTNLGTTFNAAAEWVAALNAINDFVTWFQTNWPEKTASGRPSYLAWNATTGEHQTFQIPLTGTAKTTLLARLDAILAAFS